MAHSFHEHGVTHALPCGHSTLPCWPAADCSLFHSRMKHSCCCTSKGIRLSRPLAGAAVHRGILCKSSSTACSISGYLSSSSSTSWRTTRVWSPVQSKELSAGPMAARQGEQLLETCKNAAWPALCSMSYQALPCSVSDLCNAGAGVDNGASCDGDAVHAIKLGLAAYVCRRSMYCRFNGGGRACSQHTQPHRPVRADPTDQPVQLPRPACCPAAVQGCRQFLLQQDQHIPGGTKATGWQQCMVTRVQSVGWPGQHVGLLVWCQIMG